MSMKHPKLPLAFADYQRLFRVMYSVLNSLESHTAHACKFYSIVGSYILEKAHGLDAYPRFGSALFRVDDPTDFVMAFTDMNALEQGLLGSHGDAFHAWVECEGVMIDFLAPLFRENLLSKHPDSKLRIPRKMFQKPFTAMSASPFALGKEGDFYLLVNKTLTNEMIRDFMSIAENGDLAHTCLTWYKPSPKPLLSQLGLASNDGTKRIMKLAPTELIGKW